MVTATDPRRRSASRPAGRTTLLAALSASLLLSGAADARAADSLSIGSSAAPQAGVAMTITARGSSSAPSRLRVFVQQPGRDCAAGGTGGASANAARQAAQPGSTEVIDEQTSGAFNYAAQYTPPVAGSYKICAYAFRSGPSGSMSSQVSQAFAVSEPSPAAPGSAPGANNEVSKTANCVVPKLAGRMLETARKRLHAANCIIGKVIRPSKKKAAPVRKGGRRRILKVLSTSPKAGTVLEARGRVTLRMYYVTPKTASKDG